MTDLPDGSRLVTSPRCDLSPSSRACPTVSVAAPLFNEELVLDEFLARTLAVLDQLPGTGHELVLVDDGSSDRTLEKLAQAAIRDPRIFIVALSRNFGHQTALGAALDHVRGDVAIVLDADLQDPPEAIPQFLAEYRLGSDVVYAIRVGRKENWLLRCCYFIFYQFIARLSETNVPIDAGDFGLMSRRVIDVIRHSPERNRYVRGLRSWAGFKQVGIPIERSQRFAGRSKYNLRKLLRLACDGIFSFSVVPLRLATLCGSVAVSLSLVYALYAIWFKVFRHESPQGFTALIVVITFLSGTQLLFLGVIGEYIGRIYEEVKQRPRYVVARTIGRQSC